MTSATEVTVSPPPQDGSAPAGLSLEHTSGLPISDLRHHLAEARARRAIQDLENGVAVVKSAIASLATLRGFSDAEFLGHAAVTSLVTTLRSVRSSLPAAGSKTAIDLKVSPAPGDLHRWLREGDPR
jgi:hypothetical protein